LNNNHYKSGFIIGTTKISIELILLHVKAVGGVLER